MSKGSKSKEGNKKASGLPKEALAFAKSMGFDLKGLEPEAYDIWEKLNTMAASSPFEYENFVRNAMEEGKNLPLPGKPDTGGQTEPKQNAAAAAANKKGANPAAENVKDKEEENQPIFIRPQSGFVVKLMTVGGDDGVKVREFVLLKGGEKGLTQRANIGRVIYVNMCSCKTLNLPKDDFGHEFNDPDTMSTNGVEIPMVIGFVRDVESSKGSGNDENDGDGDENEDGIINLGSKKSNKLSVSIAIDILFHPVVIEACAKKGDVFRQQVVELALGCIESERNILLDKANWSVVSGMAYFGGRGEDKSTPALFAFSKEGLPIDPNVSNEGGSDSKAGLLESVLKSKNTDDQENSSVFGSGTSNVKPYNGDNNEEDCLNGESSLFGGLSKPGIKITANGDTNLDKMLSSSKTKKKSAPSIVEIGGSPSPLSESSSEHSLETTSEPLDFIPQGTFTGRKTGYYFGVNTVNKDGYTGLGYHRDVGKSSGSNDKNADKGRNNSVEKKGDSSSSSSSSSGSSGNNSINTGFQKGFLNKVSEKGLFKEEKSTSTNQPKMLSKAEIAAIDDLMNNVDDEYGNTSSNRLKDDSQLADVFSDLAKVLIPNMPLGEQHLNRKSADPTHSLKDASANHAAAVTTAAAYSSLSDIVPAKSIYEQTEKALAASATPNNSNNNKSSSNIPQNDSIANSNEYNFVMKNKLANPNLKVEAEANEKDGKISIILSGLSADEFQFVDLQANDNTVVVSMVNDSTRTLSLSIIPSSSSSGGGSLKVDKTSMQAKAQKKKGTLTITANVL